MKHIIIHIYSNDIPKTQKQYLDQLNIELEKGYIIGYSIGVEK